MKKGNTLLAIGIAVVMGIVLVDGWAFTQEENWGDPPKLTADQREKLQALQQKFFQDTADLRRDLYKKRLEMKLLWIDLSADPEKIKAKESEILDVQRKIKEKAFDLRLAARQILPPGEYPGRGMSGWGGERHMGMRGPWGEGREGYTAGRCW